MRALDSSLDVGALPPGWSAVRTRYLCDVNTGTADTVDAEPDEVYPFFVRSDNVERSSHFTFSGEAVLTSGDGAGVGKVYHHYVGEFLAHQRVYVMNNFRGCLGRYFFYYLSSEFGPQVLAGTAKSTVESLRRPMLTDFLVAVPPEEEQRMIVDFLDRETTQVDAMIEAQRDLVRTLEVRRHAVLTDTVFQGVGSQPSMPAPSAGRYEPGGFLPLALTRGISQMPAHWSVVRFKVAMERLEERNLDSEATLMSLTSAGRVVPRAETGDRQQPAEESIPRYLVVRPGCLIINPMWLTGGAIGVSWTTGAVSPDYRVFRSRGDHDARYLHHLLRAPAYLDQYRLFTRAQTTFDRRVQQPDIDNLPLPVPQLSEQIAIADHLDRATARMDAMIDAANDSIALMQERRAALISAAVTGRIDPRTGEDRAVAV